MTEYTVAVADLARFCHRSGDIDSRLGPSPSGAQGIAGHQRIYTRRPQSYLKEHTVELDVESGDLHLKLRGRADGYDPEAGLVEEIKTCRIPPDTIPQAVSDLHLAQGRLYAAIIARQEGREGLTVKVTWLNIDTDEEEHRLEHYSAAELQLFLDNSLERYCHWLSRLTGKRRLRDVSADRMDFPHGEFREGQRHIAELTYKCIDQGAQLMIEAPTGIGKTAAVLYPAIKALATGKHDRIAFITAKTVGKLAAEEALAHCRAVGFEGAALTLTAKERVCFSPGKACHGDDCPFASAYYDKLPAAMEEALELPTLRREDIESLARRFEVCPYELAMDLLPWIDIVIADLHYIYSLYGMLGTEMESGGQRWSVLLDEAHNLPDRARGMYSATLNKAALMRCKKQAPPTICRALEGVNRRMLELQRASWQELGFHSTDTMPETLTIALTNLTTKVAESLGPDPTLLIRSPDLMDFFFDALHFQRVAQEWGPEYRFQLGRGEGKQSLKLTLNCLDPARLLQQRQQRAHAVTAFSATLSPLPWARNCLGLSEEAVCSRSASPYLPEQLRVCINTGLDTRYRQREHTLSALALQLRQWLTGTDGNCIVYFPSYRYMRDCLELLQSPALQKTLWVQVPDQNDSDRKQLFQILRERQDVAAFCILGGVLGEGIDLPGDQLASVVVVGVGMPQVNRDTREIQAYYQQTHGNGFECAFLYPGMQKVAQALGRVIRGHEDSGSALLIDPRYCQSTYTALLPPWWSYGALPEDPGSSLAAENLGQSQKN